MLSVFSREQICVSRMRSFAARRSNVEKSTIMIFGSISSETTFFSLPLQLNFLPMQCLVPLCQSPQIWIIFKISDQIWKFWKIHFLETNFSNVILSNRCFLKSQLKFYASASFENRGLQNDSFCQEFNLFSEKKDWASKNSLEKKPPLLRSFTLSNC